MKQDYTSTKEKRRGRKRFTRARREEDLLPQAEELKCQNKVDKETITDLADSLREFEKVSEEAEIILEQKKARTTQEILGARGEEH